MELNEAEELIIKIVSESIDEQDFDYSSIDLDTVLLGENALIDSLTLVNIIVDLEDEINGRTGIEISLTDDEAVFAEPSPYASIRNLSAYIIRLLS